MRAKRTAQTSLFDPATVDHPVAEELEWASAWLDAHPELLDEVAADLGAETGVDRRGILMEWTPPPDGIAMCQGGGVTNPRRRRRPWNR